MTYQNYNCNYNCRPIPLIPSLVLGINGIGQGLTWIMGLSAVSGHGAGDLISSRATLKSCHECTLLQVGTYRDLTLDVARLEMKIEKKKEKKRFFCFVRNYAVH